MKAFKKLTVILMSAILSVSALGAFGCGGRSDTENDLNINYWQSGYGIEFINTAIEGFKAKHPEYNVNLYASSQADSIMAGFGRGAKTDPVDLYISGSINRNRIKYAEPLNDILTEKADGNESKTIGQKYMPEVLDSFKHLDGNYYNLAFAGSMAGIVYNNTIIDGENFQVPRTTDELATLSRDIIETEGMNVSPFIHFSEGYWNFLYPVFQAQYDGVDYYKNTFLTLGNQDLSIPANQVQAKAILTKEDGRLKAMEALQGIIDIDSIFAGSGSADFNSAQTDFLNGNAAMMVNGGWLLNEMKKSDEVEAKFSIMRTPVISSIIEKCPNIDWDDELCALIDAIDLAIDNGTPVNEIPLTGDGYEVELVDIQKVYEARTIMMSLYNSSVFTIPNYSNAKKAAKDFIKYFYTDANIVNFSRITQTVMPVNLSTEQAIDTTGWCGFELQQLELLETTAPIYLYDVMPTTNILFTLGTASPYPKLNGLEFQYIFADNDMANEPSKFQTAKMIWDKMVTVYNENFESYLSTAGFTQN